MNPVRFATELRSIAQKIDNSRSPDRRSVARDLKRLLSRLAGRTDVINQVNAAFTGQGVYPPNLQETSPGVYEGDIDTGWTLEVTEGSDGSLELKLNDIPVASPSEAAKAYKDKDPSYLDGTPPARNLDIEYLNAMYGADFVEDDLESEEPLGSGLFWEVFMDKEITNWTPLTDIEEIVQKTRDLAVKKNLDPDKSEKEARDNYKGFLHYWPTEYKPKMSQDLLDQLPAGF